MRTPLPANREVYREFRHFSPADSSETRTGEPFQANSGAFLCNRNREKQEITGISDSSMSVPLRRELNLPQFAIRKVRRRLPVSLRLAGTLTRKINEPTPRVRAHQPYTHLVADIDTLLAANQKPFCRRVRYATRTKTPFGVTPVTTAMKVWPIWDRSATAAIRLFMTRSTLRAASSFRVQFRAMESNCWSE